MLSIFTSRPQRTFLIEWDRLRWRVDLVRSGQDLLPRVIRSRKPRKTTGNKKPRPTGPYSWIGDLLRAGPRPAKDVEILTTRMDLVLIELFTDGEPEDLNQSLGLEAQSVTGHLAADCALAWKALPGEEGFQRYLVVQGGMDELRRMRDACGDHRLRRVGHPAGLIKSTAPWIVEHWPNLTYARATDPENPTIRIWNGPEAEAEAKTDPYFPAASESEVFTDFGNHALEPSPESSDSPTTPEETFPIRWSKWLPSELNDSEEGLRGIPMIDVPAGPISPKKQILLTGATTVFTLILLSAHYTLTHQEKAQLEEQVATLRGPVEEIRQWTQEISQLRRALRAAGRDAIDPTGGPAIHRARMGVFLTGLSNANGPEIVLTRIEPFRNGQRLIGIASSPEAVTAFGSNLRDHLSAGGWDIGIQRRTALLLLDNGGPWEFEIECRLSPPRETTRNQP